MPKFKLKISKPVYDEIEAILAWKFFSDNPTAAKIEGRVAIKDYNEVDDSHKDDHSFVQPKTGRATKGTIFVVDSKSMNSSHSSVLAYIDPKAQSLPTDSNTEIAHEPIEYQITSVSDDNITSTTNLSILPDELAKLLELEVGSKKYKELAAHNIDAPEGEDALLAHLISQKDKIKLQAQKNKQAAKQQAPEAKESKLEFDPAKKAQDNLAENELYGKTTYDKLFTSHKNAVQLVIAALETKKGNSVLETDFSDLLENYLLQPGKDEDQIIAALAQGTDVSTSNTEIIALAKAIAALNQEAVAILEAATAQADAKSSSAGLDKKHSQKDSGSPPKTPGLGSKPAKSAASEAKKIGHIAKSYDEELKIIAIEKGKKPDSITLADLNQTDIARLHLADLQEEMLKNPNEAVYGAFNESEHPAILTPELIDLLARNIFDANNLSKLQALARQADPLTPLKAIIETTTKKATTGNIVQDLFHVHDYIQPNNIPAKDYQLQGDEYKLALQSGTVTKIEADKRNSLVAKAVYTGIENLANRLKKHYDLPTEKAQALAYQMIKMMTGDLIDKAHEILKTTIPGAAAALQLAAAESKAEPTPPDAKKSKPIANASSATAAAATNAAKKIIDNIKKITKNNEVIINFKELEGTATAELGKILIKPNGTLSNTGEIEAIQNKLLACITQVPPQTIDASDPLKSLETNIRAIQSAYENTLKTQLLAMLDRIEKIKDKDIHPSAKIPTDEFKKADAFNELMKIVAADPKNNLPELEKIIKNYIKMEASSERDKLCELFNKYKADSAKTALNITSETYQTMRQKYADSRTNDCITHLIHLINHDSTIGNLSVLNFKLSSDAHEKAAELKMMDGVYFLLQKTNETPQKLAKLIFDELVKPNATGLITIKKVISNDAAPLFDKIIKDRNEKLKEKTEKLINTVFGKIPATYGFGKDQLNALAEVKSETHEALAKWVQKQSGADKEATGAQIIADIISKKTLANKPLNMPQAIYDHLKTIHQNYQKAADNKPINELLVKLMKVEGFDPPTALPALDFKSVGLDETQFNGTLSTVFMKGKETNAVSTELLQFLNDSPNLPDQLAATANGIPKYDKDDPIYKVLKLLKSSVDNNKLDNLEKIITNIEAKNGATPGAYKSIIATPDLQNELLTLVSTKGASAVTQLLVGALSGNPKPSTAADISGTTHLRTVLDQLWDEAQIKKIAAQRTEIKAALPGIYSDALKALKPPITDAKLEGPALDELVNAILDDKGVSEARYFDANAWSPIHTDALKNDLTAIIKHEAKPGENKNTDKPKITDGSANHLCALLAQDQAKYKAAQTAALDAVVNKLKEISAQEVVLGPEAKEQLLTLIGLHSTDTITDRLTEILNGNQTPSTIGTGDINSGNHAQLLTALDNLQSTTKIKSLLEDKVTPFHDALKESKVIAALASRIDAGQTIDAVKDALLAEIRRIPPTADLDNDKLEPGLKDAKENRTELIAAIKVASAAHIVAERKKLADNLPTVFAEVLNALTPKPDAAGIKLENPALDKLVDVILKQDGAVSAYFDAKLIPPITAQLRTDLTEILTHAKAPDVDENKKASLTGDIDINGLLTQAHTAYLDKQKEIVSAAITDLKLEFKTLDFSGLTVDSEPFKQLMVLTKPPKAQNAATIKAALSTIIKTEAKDLDTAFATADLNGDSLKTALKTFNKQYLAEKDVDTIIQRLRDETDPKILPDIKTVLPDDLRKAIVDLRLADKTPDEIVTQLKDWVTHEDEIKKHGVDQHELASMLNGANSATFLLEHQKAYKATKNLHDVTTGLVTDLKLSNASTLKSISDSKALATLIVPFGTSYTKDALRTALQDLLKSTTEIKAGTKPVDIVTAVDLATLNLIRTNYCSKMQNEENAQIDTQITELKDSANHILTVSSSLRTLTRISKATLETAANQLTTAKGNLDQVATDYKDTNKYTYSSNKKDLRLAHDTYSKPISIIEATQKRNESDLKLLAEARTKFTEIKDVDPANKDNMIAALDKLDDLIKSRQETRIVETYDALDKLIKEIQQKKRQFATNGIPVEPTKKVSSKVSGELKFAADKSTNPAIIALRNTLQEHRDAITLMRSSTPEGKAAFIELDKNKAKLFKSLNKLSEQVKFQRQMTEALADKIISGIIREQIKLNNSKGQDANTLPKASIPPTIDAAPMQSAADPYWDHLRKKLMENPSTIEGLKAAIKATHPRHFPSTSADVENLESLLKDYLQDKIELNDLGDAKGSKCNEKPLYDSAVTADIIEYKKQARLTTTSPDEIALREASFEIARIIKDYDKAFELGAPAIEAGTRSYYGTSLQIDPSDVNAATLSLKPEGQFDKTFDSKQYVVYDEKNQPKLDAWLKRASNGGVTASTAAEAQLAIKAEAKAGPQGGPKDSIVIKDVPLTGDEFKGQTIRIGYPPIPDPSVTNTMESIQFGVSGTVDTWKQQVFSFGGENSEHAMLRAFFDAPENEASRDKLLNILTAAGADVKSVGEFLKTMSFKTTATPVRTYQLPATFTKEDLQKLLGSEDIVNAYFGRRNSADYTAAYTATTLAASGEGWRDKYCTQTARYSTQMLGFTRKKEVILPSQAIFDEVDKLIAQALERSKQTGLYPVVIKHIANPIVAIALDLRIKSKELEHRIEMAPHLTRASKDQLEAIKSPHLTLQTAGAPNRSIPRAEQDEKQKQHFDAELKAQQVLRTTGSTNTTNPTRLIEKTNTTNAEISRRKPGGR